MWIGLSDVTSENTWVNNDFTPAELSIFQGNNLNNRDDTDYTLSSPEKKNADCAVLHLTNSNYLVDRNCNSLYNFVCEL